MKKFIGWTEIDKALDNGVRLRRESWIRGHYVYRSNDGKLRDRFGGEITESLLAEEMVEYVPEQSFLWKCDNCERLRKIIQMCDRYMSRDVREQVYEALKEEGLA